MMAAQCHDGDVTRGEIQMIKWASLIGITATAIISVHQASADTWRVPKEVATIQEAIDGASPGDLILVDPGRYVGRLRLRPRITLRSVSQHGIRESTEKRAEMTIIDGGGNDGEGPGVLMAEGSTLDGFTVTNVGRFDESIWNEHFESQGEELGDDEGSVQAEGTTPAISVRSVNCTVTNCIVRHNGDVGIGLLGGRTTISPLITNCIVYRNLGGGIGAAESADAIIRGNRCSENLRAGIGCRAANPVIVENDCFGNIRAGIGCREGSRAVIRGNRCYQNRRAGIGIRMEKTAPLVEGNECYENEMAGIGCRDAASPILRGNSCHENKMAGIGCDGASPLITDNECFENKMAGIGLRGQASAVIHKNRCRENNLVAIGVTQGSSALINENQLSRTGGVPPIIAVKDDSIASIHGNQISGGGVAALLIQGRATATGNAFIGLNEKQGKAIWIWEGATATVTDNSFTGYAAEISGNVSPQRHEDE